MQELSALKVNCILFSEAKRNRFNLTHV